MSASSFPAQQQYFFIFLGLVLSSFKPGASFSAISKVLAKQKGQKELLGKEIRNCES
jgi:hypothetical protein